MSKFLVRGLRAAFQDAKLLCPKTRDRFEVRHHVRKLQYWSIVTSENEAFAPQTSHSTSQKLAQQSPQNLLIDLQWSWLKELQGQSIGELVIDDCLGSWNSLRIIFYVSGMKREQDTNEVIWWLATLQKDHQHFSAMECAIILARQQLVIERFYDLPIDDQPIEDV